jgi:hypothetical protein
VKAILLLIFTFCLNPLYSQFIDTTHINTNRSVNLYLNGSSLRPNKRIVSYRLSDNLKFTMSTGINRINPYSNIDVLAVTRFDMRVKYYLPNYNSLVFRLQTPNIRRTRFISIGYVKKF